MKKLLALVLALVMSMSLVTISNAAFKDADKISNKEAVDVMAAVGVLAGYDNGEFGATDTLTRAQACKIIAYLDLGKDVAEALPAVQVFSDLSANNWAAKYVAYCADAGYVSGVGDKKFAPDEKVTGYQFGKMLLCALGYDQKIEEMTGSSWEIKVAKLMESNSISKGTSKLGSAVLTREEAAQMTLNALKTPTVEYATKGSNITVNGAEINFGASVPTYVTNTVAKEQTISKDTLTNSKEYTIELGEKLYKKLVLSDTTDAFGRPTRTWTFENKKVGEYVKDADLEYTAAVEYKATIDRRAGARRRSARPTRGMPLLSSVHGGQSGDLPRGGQQRGLHRQRDLCLYHRQEGRGGQAEECLLRARGEVGGGQRRDRGHRRRPVRPEQRLHARRSSRSSTGSTRRRRGARGYLYNIKREVRSRNGSGLPYGMGRHKCVCH